MTDAELARSVAVEAGHLLKSLRASSGLQGAPLGALGDRDANTLILDRLRAARPDDFILSEESVDDRARCAALLDRHLADTSYVAGERFSIADIAVGLAAHRWFQLPLEREERPNIHRWLGVLAQRPASSAVLSLPLT